jgi:hypothetical protein
MIALGYPEDGGSILLRNFDSHPENCMVSRPNKTTIETVLKRHVI